MIQLTIKSGSGGDPVAALAERARRLSVWAEKLPEEVAAATISALEGGSNLQMDFTAGPGQRSANSMPWYKAECIDEAIAQQGLDERWDDNAPYTKEKKGEDKPVLVDSGEMKDSFMLDVRTAGDGVEVWLSNTAPDNRWALNWEGFPNPVEGWQDIPARPLGYIGAKAFSELANNIAAYLRLKLDRVLKVLT